MSLRVCLGPFWAARTLLEKRAEIQGDLNKGKRPMKRIDEYKESVRDLEKWQAYYTPSGQVKGTTTWEKDH